MIYADTEEVSVLLETSEDSSIFLPNTVSMMQALNWNQKERCISVCLFIFFYWICFVLFISPVCSWRRRLGDYTRRSSLRRKQGWRPGGNPCLHHQHWRTTWRWWHKGHSKARKSQPSQQPSWTLLSLPSGWTLTRPAGLQPMGKSWHISSFSFYSLWNIHAHSFRRKIIQERGWKIFKMTCLWHINDMYFCHMNVVIFLICVCTILKLLLWVHLIIQK